MADPEGSILATRGPQIFPRFSDEELARLSRFGEPRRYVDGETLVRAGETGPGLLLVLSGEVEVRQHDRSGDQAHIVTHGRGNMMGELAALSGRPSLVDAVALDEVEAVAIAPDRLRALLIAEAELGERVMRALILRRVNLIAAGAGPTIVGGHAQADMLRLVNFLRRNGHPYQQLDPASDPCAQTLVERFHIHAEELPIVLCPNGQLLRNPTEGQLARCLGLVGPIDPEKLYDVLVVGAGPAGLATSVYAGSEGLSVLTLDCRSFGGQAGASARIENYFGFPTGISGIALTARAYNQAQKFGVQMAIPDEAVTLDCGNDPCRVQLATGEWVQARVVVIASGARYRRLGVARLDEFEGTSVHYWASPLEADLAAGQDVVLVGGGNSAGQATVMLAGRARLVTVVVRRPLAETMSRYLIDRIEGLANVEVRVGVEVTALYGSGGVLEAVTLADRVTGEATRQEARLLFSFIGADPNTDWLQGSGLALDPGGFILTGNQVGEDRYPLESSRRGVFAIGDVRSSSVKRVAASVGDGAQVVAAIHSYLARAEIPPPLTVTQPALAGVAAGQDGELLVAQQPMSAPNDNF